jgi:hypothetical protein
MRKLSLALPLLGLLAGAAPVEAATVMIMVDPVSLERTVHVLDANGPDRILLCTAPPSLAGCRDITQRRR